jgi:penicillin-binding protein 1C
MRGNQHAAPIAFDIFRQLYAARAAAPWFAQPAGITSRVVCAVSGQALGPHCPRRAVAHVIRGVSDPTPCCVHQLRPPIGGDGTWTVTEVWPPAIQRYLRSARPAPLTITTPSDRGTYRVIASDLPNANVLALQAAAPHDAGALYWFVDDACIGVGAPDAALHWTLRPGRHIIACCDERGNAARAAILVEHSGARP